MNGGSYGIWFIREFGGLAACLQISGEIHRLLQDCRDFGLKDQMTRAAVSIASNIAEGAERGSVADYTRFLYIAKGSAAELRTQLYIAMKLGSMLHEEKAKELLSEVKELSNMLYGLIKALNRIHPQL